MRLIPHHARFLGAAAAGLAVAAALPAGVVVPDRVLVGADLFFLIYLGLTIIWLGRLEGRDLRARFEAGDEGTGLVLVLALGAVAVSLFAIIATLAGTGAGRGPVAHSRPVLALAAVPLGWLTVHTVMALHYAGMFYRAVDLGGDPDSGPRGDRGGLDFGQDGCEPGPWEFLYYSFTLGMTAQTSDVAVVSTAMRRATLLHGILSYFYNAVIVALAVNAGLALGQGGG